MAKSDASGAGRFGRHGQLKVFQNSGVPLRQTYRDFDRHWDTEKDGAYHVKMFYQRPYVMVVSTHLAVSSRANVEAGCVMKVSETAQAYMSCLVIKGYGAQRADRDLWGR